MSDLETSEEANPAAEMRAPALAFRAAPQTQAPVSFDRSELREILNLYGRKVAEGEWRDYAVDFTAQKAIFSVYRRACECALYRIEKTPKLARKQGAYAVVATGGLVLKRGGDLRRVLAVLDKRLRLVSS
ncbi:DUF2794 domain-containing protein [Methylocella silvestris]|uniref:DUF2794 domain-containing protein n=1 Tax=Methylocella silvestris TaxID=199596 RepID=A0A2J7TJ44_METSI|nr:DUF2794 domain-containing protein [Methylocella silvestris]PNG26792.1 hypothetical protein CR492_07100 [Methylocella silvestris]